MKKILNFLGILVIGLFLTLPLSNVQAASATIDIYSSNKNPTVGSTITITIYVKSSSALGSYEYTLNYDSNKLKLTSGDLSSAEVANSNSTKNMTKTFQFKVIATGSSTVSVKSYAVYGWDEKSMSVNVDPVTVTGKTASSSGSTTTNYSTNNYLSSLEVEGEKISPSFNKNTNDYTLTVDSSVEKINIKASKEDSKASISGTGEKNVSEGENKFEIVVTSEKGTKRTYTLTVTVEDQNPIKVKVDDQEYTIVKRASVLEKPATYEEEELEIDGENIPVFVNETIGYTLVGLKDAEGNIALFRKIDDIYVPYQEYTFNQITVALVEPENIPEGFTSKLITYGEEEEKTVEGYTLNEENYLYAINVETGKTNWYRFEKEEETIQIVNLDTLTNLTKKIDQAKRIITVLGTAVLILAILTITIAIIKSKVKPDKDKNKEKKDKKQEKNKNNEKVFDKW